MPKTNSNNIPVHIVKNSVPSRYCLKLCIYLIGFFFHSTSWSQVTCPQNVFAINDAGECGAIVLDISPDIGMPQNAFDSISYQINGATNLQGANDASGTFFQVGTSTVEYYLLLNGMPIDSCQFQVDVFDFEAATSTSCFETIEVREDGLVQSDPANLLSGVEALNECQGVIITLSPIIATDNCGAPITINQTGGPDITLPFVAGTYTLDFTLKDNNGNSSTCSIFLEVNSLPDFQIFGLPNPIGCVGDVIELKPSTYPIQTSINWFGPNEYTSNDLSPDIELNSLTAGDYTLVYESANNCLTESTVSISIAEDPQIVLSSNAPICEGGLILSASTLPNSTPVAEWNWWGPCNFSADGASVNIPDFSLDCVGEYFVTAVTNLGCEKSESIMVSAINLPVPALSLNCENSICVGQSCTLIGTAYSGANTQYFWEADEGILLPPVTDLNQISVQAELPGSFEVKYRVDSEGCLTDWVSVEINAVGGFELSDVFYEIPFETFTTDLSFLNLATLPVEYDFEIIQIPSNGLLTVNSGGTFNYDPAISFYGDDSFRYRVCDRCPIANCREATVRLEVLITSECEIPSVITPNNDDKNDEFKIICLEKENNQGSQIVIYNQWGDQVFEAAPYLNNWNGTLQGQDNNPLPDGTYFYVIKLSEASEVLQGSVTIIR